MCVEEELADENVLKHWTQMVEHFCNTFSDFFSFLLLIPLLVLQRKKAIKGIP